MTAHAADPRSGFRVAAVGPADLPALVPAWHDLAARALERNVFLEPAFAVPALRHLYPPACVLLTVEAADGRLLALLPLLPPGTGRPTLARVPLHAQATLGTPLLDATLAPAAVGAILAWLRAERPEVVGLLVPRLPCEGATMAALAAAGASAPLVLIDRHARAVLPHGASAEDHWRESVRGKRLKEWRRQERRLADAAGLRFVSAEEPAAIAEAIEQFMTLEGRGWKGARRTALISQPALATFTRAMSRGLAEQGGCRVDALLQGDTPIAMGIVLRAGATAAFWKTTFDERAAARSPGVQLAMRITARQLADPGIATTDSCAVAGHPMIDRLWPARIALADVVVPLRPATDPDLRRVLRRDAAERRLRRMLKELLRHIRPHTAV